MKAAIATVVIGESYRRHYAQIFQPSVQRYAKRHGYDLLLFDQYLCAPELRHSSTVDFTKLLIPVQPAVQAYERLMVLDADILIHRDTLPFDALELDTGIGIVDEWSQPTPAERVAYQQALGLETRPRDYYALAGFTLETNVVLNGGMFICSPACHFTSTRTWCGGGSRPSCTIRADSTTSSRYSAMNSSRLACIVCCLQPGTVSGRYTAPAGWRLWPTA